MAISYVVEFVLDFRRRNPAAKKDETAEAAAQAFHLTRRGAPYVGRDIALRFSEANTPSFAGTVMALSTLARIDNLPVVVVVVRPGRTEFLLANSTLLKKISHSSQALSTAHIRGSFNGSDILREHSGMANQPENFEALFAVFDRTVLSATRVQFHWAGRNSRGVTQLTGDFARVFASDYREEIDVAEAVHWIEELLNL